MGSSNLVAYYKFSTGALTTDSKDSYTLTSHGSPTTITGKYGTGIRLNTTTDYYSRSSAWTTNGTDFSVSAWARNYSRALWSCTASNNEHYLQFFSDRLVLHSMNTDTTIGGVTKTFPAGYNPAIWHHYVVTVAKSGSNYISTLYLDSVSLGNTTTTNKTVAACQSSQYIGYFAVENKNGSGGDVDDFAFFNKALSQAEITSLYIDTGGSLFFNLI